MKENRGSISPRKSKPLLYLCHGLINERGNSCKKRQDHGFPGSANII